MFKCSNVQMFKCSNVQIELLNSLNLRSSKNEEDLNLRSSKSVFKSRHRGSSVKEDLNFLNVFEPSIIEHFGSVIPGSSAQP